MKNYLKLEETITNALEFYPYGSHTYIHPPMVDLSRAPCLFHVLPVRRVIFPGITATCTVNKKASIALVKQLFSDGEAMPRASLPLSLIHISEPTRPY